MWNMKRFVIPGTGIITKGLMIYRRNDTRKAFDRLSTAVRGTSHIIRKVLQSETRNLSGGVYHWF